MPPRTSVRQRLLLLTERVVMVHRAVPVGRVAHYDDVDTQSTALPRFSSRITVVDHTTVAPKSVRDLDADLLDEIDHLLASAADPDNDGELVPA